MQHLQVSTSRWALLALVGSFSILFSACDTLTSLVVSNQQEVEIGAEMAEELFDEFQLLTDNDPVTQWAKALVAGMGDASDDFRDRSKFGGYKVHVIYDNELVNAFAAPGGYIYIVSGLILQANSCAEVAGVVGHEMAHVTQRHSARAIAKNAGILGLTDILLNDGVFKESANILYLFMQNTTFSRKDETEADKVGATIMYNAGYNPIGLANMFRILGGLAPEEEPSNPNRFAEFFSSHPDSNRRVAAIEDQIAKSWPTVGSDGQHTLDCQSTGGELSFTEVQRRLKAGEAKIQQGSGTRPH